MEKTHQLFQHKFFGPHPKPPSLAPQKKNMYLISWERTQKWDTHNFLGGIFGVKHGVPNGPFSATKKNIVFLALKFTVHAKGVVLCERACFCLLSTCKAPSIKRSLLSQIFLRTLSSLKTPYRHLLRSLLRNTYC